MLEVASAQSYGRIYDISEQEREQIMKPLREEKLKEEQNREGFDTEEDKQKAEQLKQKIEDLKARLPAHSISAAMMEELDELEAELEELENEQE